jgi:site-specific DNA recombinase
VLVKKEVVQMIAIYARVSTEEQAKHGFSIPAQIRECQECIGEGDPLVFADEGVSGETLQRPALEELRQRVHRGEVKAVYCLDPDRLSRKLLHQLLLTEEWERQGVSLHFVNGDYSKTPEGNLFYALRGAISEFEKAKITERMCRGRLEKARQGRVLRDFKIYGYCFEPEREQLVVHPQEAAVVRQIYRWFIDPPPSIQSIAEIARTLTRNGVPTKRGAKNWHRQVVRQILSNKTYVGEFYQNKWDTTNNRVRLRPREEWIHIPCPQIIDRETFNVAQSILASLSVKSRS